MASKRKDSPWLKETSDQSGFDNFDRLGNKKWRSIKQNGLTIAPDEFDTPPPSTRSLGGADITGSPRANSLTTTIPSVSQVPVNYLTDTTQIPVNPSFDSIQIVGSNQTVNYTTTDPPVDFISYMNSSDVINTTLSHTCSNRNRLLLVGVTSEDSTLADRNITSVTYNSVSMTSAVTATVGNNSSHIWYLIAPDSGTNNIIVTWAGSVSACSVLGISYYSMLQSGQPDAIIARSAQTVSSVSAILVAVTSHTVIFDSLNSSTQTIIATAGSNQNLILSNSAGSGSGFAHVPSYSHRLFTGTGNVTNVWNFNAVSNSNPYVVASFTKIVQRPLPYGSQNQKVTLQSIGSSVTLNEGNGITLTANKSVVLDSGGLISFIYSATDNLWHETSRVTNGGI